MQRRHAVLQELNRAERPVSATVLAKQFSVSRQIIVGDIALLRAEGHAIDATPRGYLLQRSRAGLIRTIAVCHTSEQTVEELNICVDNGCTVLDVIVEHPLYGQLAGKLELSSRYEVEQFIAKSRQTNPLSMLTDGIHLHTLRCPDEAAYQRVCEQLQREGILLN